MTLEQERTPDEYRKVLGETAEQVVSLSEAVHAMMRLAQSEAGLPAEHRVPVAIAEPGARGRASSSSRWRPSRAWHLELGTQSRKRVVSGEPAWLHQCFANLVRQRDPLHARGRQRSASSWRSRPAARRARAAWRDTGVGIDAAERERIFEPYHRVRAASPRTGPGAGLGLALAREIARAHGGDVGVESEPGKGSTFTVRLPLAPAA